MVLVENKNVDEIHVAGRVNVPTDIILRSPGWYIRKIRKLIAAKDLTVVGRPGSAKFEGGGFTLFIILAESHISLHTWVERGYVHLDVFVCNVTRDNTDRARALFDEIAGLFGDGTIKAQEFSR